MTEHAIAPRVFVREDPVPADLAMVFGAANELDRERRTRWGVQLYRAGFVPRVLVTGGGVVVRTCPEARRMAEIARDQGLPASALLVEDRSRNTFENVQFSVALLQANGVLDALNTVVLVSSEWHMRRVLLTARKYFPGVVRLVCCPTLEGCNRDNWTQSKAYRTEVLDESLLLETFLETGALSDWPQTWTAPLS